MLVYTGMKSDFMRSVDEDTIADEIRDKIYEKMGRHTGESEFRSWMNSMEYMYKVLSDQQIPEDVGIAIEYNIPQTSKRVDFIISGYDETDDANLVVIELKQWDKVTRIEGQDGLVETFTGGANRTVVHPSYQAWSYAKLIEDYNATVQEEKIRISPCAYLHNYVKKDNDPLLDPQYEIYYKDAPAFIRGQVPMLRGFIKERVATGDQEAIIQAVDHGVIRPSKSLQNAIASMVKGNQEFIMIDDQKVVYEEIRRLSSHCLRDGKKRTVIVEGGPGTGKSVIAINLLADLTADGQFVQYVSKNSAPRNVYSQMLKGEMLKSSIDNMFKGSGAYTEIGDNAINTLLVDEAHRLNEKSGMFRNKGENQIKEIIHSAACSVFFIDESQRVTLQDIGSVGEIEKWAKEAGSEVAKLELTSQFRCNGSDGYLAWLDDTLEIRETANYSLKDIDFDVRICDSPSEVYDLIKQKNQAPLRARMLAGYCWDWIKEGKNDSSVHDIVIGDFEMSWNLGNTQTYAIDEGSIDQIGCIHTSQGLEFDYVGVIIGDDLRYEDGHIVTDYTKRASTDQSLKGINKMARENPEKAAALADEIIKNTYRTLLTRGMKGCYVFCTDEALSEYLKKRVTNI